MGILLVLHRVESVAGMNFGHLVLHFEKRLKKRLEM